MTKDEQIAVLTRTIAEYQKQLERERSISAALESINRRQREQLDEMEGDGNGDD